MYLLLVDNNFVSSREIKSLLDKSNIDCEVINCSSSEALIDIAEKLAPDIVIIDFDFYIDDSDAIVRRLRQINKDAYILAFIDADHYENLRLAIDEGVDDYLVKPLQREDIMLRIKMGLQRKSMQVTNQAADTEQVARKSEKETRKLFLEIADAFGRQDEDQETVQAKDEDTLKEPVDELAAQLNQPEAIYEIEEFSHEDHGNDQVDKQEDTRDYFSETPDYKGIAESDHAVRSEDLFDLEPEPGPVTGKEEDKTPLTEYQAERDSFDDFGLTGSDEISDNIDKELPELSDDDFKLFEPIEPDMTKPESSGHKEDDLESLKELFQGPADYQPGSASAREEKPYPPEPDFQDVALHKEAEEVQPKSDKVDDSELFGTNDKALTNGSKTFEDLFGKSNQQGKSSKVASPERKIERDKQAKVEYLFPEHKSGETNIPAPPAIPSNYLPPQNVAYTENKPLQEQHEQGSDKKGSSFTRIAGNVVTVILLVMLFSLSFFLIQSRINEGTPTVAGYKMFVVLSGSMSPAFDTGSLVFVKPTEPLEIVENDIITFSSAADANRLTTHRVVGINRENGLSFVTRGDANNVNDPSPVPAENLVGKVTGSVPYVGYLFGFAQTRQGLILLIFVPGLLILLFEFRKIFSYLVDARVEKMAAAGGPGHSPGPPAGSDGPGSSQGSQADFNFTGRSYGRHG
jgi:signal peptidase I